MLKIKYKPDTEKIKENLLRYDDLLICFICNTKCNLGTECYNEGGIVQCLLNETTKKLHDKNVLYLKDENDCFFIASKHLELQLSGSCHDIYAADVFYHQSY